MLYTESLIQWLNSFGFPPPLSAILIFGTYAVLLFTAIALFALFGGYLERKTIARIHNRYGPTYVGPFGLLQNFADLAKFLSKEDIVPTNANQAIFKLAPLAIIACAFLAAATLPFSPNAVGLSLTLGLLFVFALFSLIPGLILLIGWSTGSKYAMIGGMRSAIQMISYEAPMLLSVVGIVAISRSMNLIDIVSRQDPVWFIFLQPLGFLVFFIAMLADVERTPFDLDEAESELVSGWNTEYSGMRFGLVFLADYIRVFVGSTLAALLFLGGWNGPILPGPWWLFLKILLVFWFVVFTRATLPRIRLDQLLRFGFSKMMPLVLLNILITVALARIGLLGA